MEYCNEEPMVMDKAENVTDEINYLRGMSPDLDAQADDEISQLTGKHLSCEMAC